MKKYDISGLCSFCSNCSHEFPNDSWHEMKHNAGWHSCQVFGGFRYRKPDCAEFVIADGVGGSFIR
jgi:hypothetical protein